MNQANLMTGFEGLFPGPAARQSGARRATYRHPLGNGLRRWLGGLRQAFELRREQDRTRRALAQLDDRLLRDIGLSRADLGVELEPPFLGLGEALTHERGGERPGLAEARVGLWHL
jgi:uncharacterized protein YjiS (DUF1127 family)